jgi:hypothetical protein
LAQIADQPFFEPWKATTTLKYIPETIIYHL